MRTRIEWVRNQDGTQGYTINPVKGLCPIHCRDNFGKEYCYSARPNGLYKRFKWNPDIRFSFADTMREIFSIKKPSKIFVGSTMELFGEWIHPAWQNKMFSYIPLRFPQHTFIFLTKRPENLPKEFPENCWVGVSVTNQDMLNVAIDNLQPVLAKVKFLSFEPLLERTWARSYEFVRGGIDWVIIGSQTQPIKHPVREWVDEILVSCEETCASVFIKEPLASHLDIKRQELPNG